MQHVVLFEQLKLACINIVVRICLNCVYVYAGTCIHVLRHSEHEPAINRYGVGGNFAPHRDKQALTVNVLLRAGDAFEGGGTLTTNPRLPTYPPTHH